MVILAMHVNNFLEIMLPTAKDTVDVGDVLVYGKVSDNS